MHSRELRQLGSRRGGQCRVLCGAICAVAQSARDRDYLWRRPRLCAWVGRGSGDDTKSQTLKGLGASADIVIDRPRPPPPFLRP